MQIFLTMVEREKIDLRLMLDEPLLAVLAYSHDPSLATRMRLADGRRWTLTELNQAFFEAAAKFVDDGGCEGLVPRAGEIIEAWGQLLRLARHKDFKTLLVGKVDWVTKLFCIEQALRRRPQLDWLSPETKRLDHMYSSIDPEEGLFFAMERAGLVEQIIDPADRARFTTEPPADSRAWTLAMLLRVAGPDQVEYVNWDCVRFRVQRPNGGFVYRSLELADPLGYGRDQTSRIFESSQSLDEILDRLERLSPA